MNLKETMKRHAGVYGFLMDTNLHPSSSPPIPVMCLTFRVQAPVLSSKELQPYCRIFITNHSHYATASMITKLDESASIRT